jgi:eukaryotic-like serine/threonine-protein kinase
MLPLQREEKERWSGQAIPIGTKIDRYVVGKKFAQGGMAEVYMANAPKEHGFTKELVLKVVLPELAEDEEYMKMFITEACLASKLDHPNIVQVLDFGRYQDRYFIAMEHIHGVSLRRLRARCRHLKVNIPPKIAAAICADVASALHYVHSFSDRGQHLNLVHRDVSPHNILLAANGAVKLTDFGIAKAATIDTRPGMIKGKFAYLSPEQSLAQPLDGRSDIFSLGIVYWESLTGIHLFGGKDDTVTLNAVQRTPIVSPRNYCMDVPKELADVALKALARPLRDRYQTADEMEWALKSYCAANAKRSDTSVAQFIVAKFPPKDNFQSTIEPSAVESDVPKLAVVAARPISAPTVPLRPISPSLRLVAELSDDPADWPTIRVPLQDRPGRTTISLPRPPPSSDCCQVTGDAPPQVNDAPQTLPEGPSMSDNGSSPVVVETPTPSPTAPRAWWDDALRWLRERPSFRWLLKRPTFAVVLLGTPVALCTIVGTPWLAGALAPGLSGAPQPAEGGGAKSMNILRAIASASASATQPGKPLGLIPLDFVILVGLGVTVGLLSGSLAWIWIYRALIRNELVRDSRSVPRANESKLGATEAVNE